MELNNQISIFIPSTDEGNKPAKTLQEDETRSSNGESK